MLVILPANPTPVAMPSGMLCKMMAIIIIKFELLFLFIFKSNESIMNIPNNIPNIGGNQLLLISIDGLIKDKKDATNITPAENPNAFFTKFLLLLIKYTLNVPIIVPIKGIIIIKYFIL